MCSASWPPPVEPITTVFLPTQQTCTVKTDGPDTTTQGSAMEIIRTQTRTGSACSDQQNWLSFPADCSLPPDSERQRDTGTYCLPGSTPRRHCSVQRAAGSAAALETLLSIYALHRCMLRMRDGGGGERTERCRLARRQWRWFPRGSSRVSSECSSAGRLRTALPPALLSRCSWGTV